MTENRTRRVKHEFAYTGLVHCGHCACMFVGELKKRRYVYYHCTGNRGKCPEPYTRQEVLDREFSAILQELVIPPPVIEWLTAVVLEPDRTERARRQQTIKRLRARYDQLKARTETMYVDKIEGRISEEFFDKQASAWRNEQDAILRQIQQIQSTAPAPVEQAIDIMQLRARLPSYFCGKLQ